MKIIPVVVCYNPEKLGENIVVKNIETYSDVFEKIIVVDNSNNSNYNIFSNISNSVYLPNYKNLGIAEALNQGCKKALELNYEWVLTMDQDSRWDDKESLLLYIDRAKQLYFANGKNVSFSPNMINITPPPSYKNACMLNDIKRKIKDKLKQIKKGYGSRVNIESSCSGYLDVKIVWTSGNILKLNIWELLGGFNEMLFIDDVDHEFCYRLRQQGYIIKRILTCNMNHNIGEHEGIRMYYIIRNCLYMKKYWPDFYIDFKRGTYLRGLFLKKIKELKFIDLYYMYKGIKDAKKNKYGKYNNENV
jgi:rhamnosyltransferase